MTDTIQKIADEVATYQAPSNGQYIQVHPKVMRDWEARLRALSARASAGEGGVRRNPAFVGEWHARAVALGYDGVADMLHSVERGEPPLHIAEVMARAAATAPQPAQAGDRGVCDCIASRCLHEKTCASLTTPASPATGQVAAGCAHVWVLGQAGMMYCDQCGRQKPAAAPQPAQAGASGGGDERVRDALEYLASIPGTEPYLRPIREALATPASPATGESSPFTCDECGKVECCPEFHESPQPAAAQGGDISTQPHPRWSEASPGSRHPKLREDWDWRSDGPDNGGGLERSRRRLSVAGDYDDPRAPDQMALVLRIDLIRLLGSLTWRETQVKSYREHLAAAPQPQPPINSAETYSNPIGAPAHGDGEVLGFLRKFDADFIARKQHGQCQVIIYQERPRKDAVPLYTATRPTPEAQEARDAARYRWLRQFDIGIDHQGYDDYRWYAYAKPEPRNGRLGLDAVIDAALALPAQGEGNNG